MDKYDEQVKKLDFLTEENKDVLYKNWLGTFEFRLFKSLPFGLIGVLIVGIVIGTLILMMASAIFNIYPK